MYDNSELPKPSYQLENLDYEDIRFIAEKCYESIYRKMREWKEDPTYINIIIRSSRFQIAKQIFPSLIKESAMRYALEGIFEEMQWELEIEFQKFINTLDESSHKEELMKKREFNLTILNQLLQLKNKL